MPRMLYMIESWYNYCTPKKLTHVQLLHPRAITDQRLPRVLWCSSGIRTYYGGLASQAKLQVHRHTGIVALARLIILVIPASHGVLRDACSRQDSSFFLVQSNTHAYSEHDFSLAQRFGFGAPTHFRRPSSRHWFFA